MSKNVITCLREMQWNSPLQFEPVGMVVLVLLEDMTIRKAYRKAPSDSRDKTGIYFFYKTNIEIEKKVIGWAYPISITADLENYTLQHYNELKSSGLLFEFYPHATGNSNDDLQAICVDEGYVSIKSGTSTTCYKKRYYYDIVDEDSEMDVCYVQHAL